MPSHRFETLLSAHLIALLAGCWATGPVTTDSGRTVPRDCARLERDPQATAGDTVLSVGYVVVEPGATCPDVEDVTSLGHQTCCPAHIHEGTVCGFEGRLENQIQDPYYGYFQSAQTGDTGDAEIVDLCLYEGVFEVGGTCCGRPLLHEGAPVVARLGGTGWNQAARPDTHGLSAETRETLGRTWLDAALLEHASVASFARFTLELMRWGAPPELLEGSHRAGVDEIAHAQLCFALAGAYLGREVGPAEMPEIASVELAASLEDFLEAVIREGCVGETLAAVEAATRLQHTTDPAVRQALRQIIEDESRHAALAWSTVRWAVAAHPELADHVDHIFAAEETRWNAELPTAVPADAAARRHGALTPQARSAALRGAWEQVVAPAWAALG